MKPSNVMFTTGDWDGWNSRTVLASQSQGGPGRKATQNVPSCNAAPAGTDVFGLVYQGLGHGMDLMAYEGLGAGFNYKGVALDTALPLFKTALDGWLPCFEKHEVKPTDTNFTNPVGSEIAAPNKNTTSGEGGSKKSGASLGAVWKSEHALVLVLGWIGVATLL